MLDGLRNFASTWMGKVLGAFLLVGLAGFGITGVITSIGTNNVARVGDQDITVADFQRAYNNQLSAVAQQLGSIPTGDQAMALGIPSAVLTQLANSAALSQLGAQFNLGASEERLAELLRQDPNFANAIGAFDRTAFRRILQSIGMTETEYFKQQTQAAQRQQVIQTVFGDVDVPAAAGELVNRYSTDRRTVEYFTVHEFSVPTPADPTDADLQAYLDEHQTSYRTQATRTVRLMTLSPDGLAARIEISDAEVQAEYERTQANYIQPERRTIVQVLLPLEATAQMFEAAANAGMSFDNLVTSTGLDMTVLGTLAEAEITDPALAAAAFALPEGGFAVIDGVQGKRAIAVPVIDEGGLQPLEEVADDIRDRLANAQARDQFIDVLDQIEEMRAAFRSLEEIAGSFGLDVDEVPVTASGAELAVVGKIPADARTRVASSIFAAEIGRLTPSIPISSELSVWYDLLQIDEARDQTLDEVRDEVAAAWMAEKTDEAMTEAVSGYVDRIQGGEALALVASAIGQFPEVSEPFTRDGTDTGIISGPVAAEAFAGGVGHVGAGTNTEGAYIVFQVTGIQPGAVDGGPELTQYLQNTMREDLYAGFVSALRDDAGLRINQQVLSDLLGLGTTGQ